MIFKLEITMDVSDQSRKGYEEPNGFENVVLYFTDIDNIQGTVAVVAAALVIVCHSKFMSALAEENIKKGE